MILVRRVAKEFATATGARAALNNISLVVERGKTATILGPTGCGKTTLLNLIAGYIRPSRGDILVEGKSIEKPTPDRGFMFQRPTLFPWLTVLQNVEFPCRFGTGVGTFGSAAEIRTAAGGYLERVGLADARDLYPHQISGGMQSRAALARLLLAQSPILLMDEPFAALDAQTRLSMQRLLTRVVGAEDKKTIVFITHDVEEALLISDDIYLMSASPGRILRHVEVPFSRSADYEEVVSSADFMKLKHDLINQLERLIPN
jgi:NitT/TauT family transport system ATP-binding protein